MATADSMLKKIHRSDKKIEKRTAIADDMFIPNLSGDHSKGKVRATPTQDTDMVNKAYVDVAGLWEVDGAEAQLKTAIDIDMQDKEIKFIDNIYLGSGEGDHYIYFYEDGSPTGEYIKWDNASDRFEFSDLIYGINVTMTGTIIGGAVVSNGDMYTTGANDDFWLGTTTQANASFQAYADGRVIGATLNLTAQGQDLSMNTHKITSLVDPADNQDAATKKYVDDNDHAEAHNIASHSDTTGTGAELNTLTDNSMADTLHRHSELSASDGTPDQAVTVDGDGNMSVTQTLKVADKIEHDGDPDTYITFNALDRFAFFAGGVEFLRVSEALGDVITFNPGGGNVDLEIRDATTGIAFRYDQGEAKVYIGKDVVIDLDVAGSTLLNWAQLDEDLRVEASGIGGAFFVQGSNGYVGVRTVTPTTQFSVKEKSGMSAIGGFCIKLTNRTGGNSVQGEVVKPSAANNDAVILAITGELNPIGVFLESGIANGAEAWIVVGGIADVLADTAGFTRGDRLVTSVAAATVGRATTNNLPAVAVHFQEIGHAIETAAANTLGRAVLHFL